MKRWAILIIMLVLLSGCSRIEEQVPGQPRLVTAVEASYESGTIRLQRQYTDGDKVRAVLMYLRCLSPYGSAQDEADAAQGNMARITVSFSDGTAKVYEQRCDSYLRQDSGPWQYIDPDRAQELPLLLGLMESD